MSVSERIYRDVGGRKVPGVRVPIYIHNHDTHYLTDLKVYQDGMVDCWRLIPFAELREKVESGWVVTTLPPGAKVSIYPLSQFKATKVFNGVAEEDLLREVADHIEALNGRPTSEKRCLAVLRAYKDAPTEENKARLREAYEAIPSHNRHFILGDMDLKDLPIRLIVYGPQEIEGWSHRAASRKQRMPLPDIDVTAVLERLFPGPATQSHESPYMALAELYREIAGGALFPKETLAEVDALFKAGRGEEGLARVLVDLRGVLQRFARRPAVQIQLAWALSSLGSYLERLNRGAEAVELYVESFRVDPDGNAPGALARMAVRERDAALALRWDSLMAEFGLEPDGLEGVDLEAVRALLGRQG